MADLSPLEKMRFVLREDDIPFFSPEDLQKYLDLNGGVVDDAIYQCLIVKAETPSLAVSGLDVGNMADYFKMLAGQYRPSNSGLLGE